ncbi:protein of unknown function [Taphrina deformans PYCC 5710]|uniref:Uncharacterized protein n=1 Tax=Taphrina deformans (strain PYCC 5710 / ATCC 11124 / CBS 356.35 / IMI 108563 / JCM 9778 / NBRC 8474) TaxID=1097556 RepID=R4XK75_TAPDE|nr:protein of unknown function [Taphrina deformans PYCC 5710]|eukprot:CCG83719.1 protein of unknown function [Taphrina deformans PYCC 5710]
MRPELVDNAATPWQTSKCHRVLRPLKLKINALERALSTSHSVADGLTAWSILSRKRSKTGNVSDSSAAYRPTSTRVRKYGNVRCKQRLNEASSRNEDSNDVFAEELLSSLRSRVTPALGNAYVGVYYAFTSILEKKETKHRFPTLASRAAHTVGRCVHLTSHQFSDDPIEPDEWYESVPAHYRSAVVVGNALQLILSAVSHVRPLLPVIALALSDSPLSMQVMDTVLDHTDISTCRKADVQELQALADRVQAPWALRRHFSEIFRIDLLKYPGFQVVLDCKSETTLDAHAQALYVKANMTVLQYLRRKQKSQCTNDDRYYELLEEMSCRVFRCADIQFVRLLQALAYSIAVLVNDVANMEMIQVVQSQTKQVLQASVRAKEDCLEYLTSAFSSEQLVEVVECLVGRQDELAITLARTCATTFEGDFVAWAFAIEKDVLQAKSGGDELKYRFEPLLDSWVARTPGLKKVMNAKIVQQPRDESDEEETSVDEDEYQGDRSRSQLSFAEIECEDENDLLADVLSHGNSITVGLLEALSHKKSSERLQSAKLLQRYGKLSSKSMHSESPLAAKRSRSLLSDDSQMLCTSPLIKRAAKRPRYKNIESSRAIDFPTFESHRISRTKRQRITHVSSEPTTDLLLSPTTTPDKRVARKALRELNKLKSGFAILRQKRPGKHMPLHVEPETECEPLEEDEISVVGGLLPGSEIDELSML